MRDAGILLHISSLPSPHGIGTLGKAAYDFTDFLEKTGTRYWQILPLGPTGCGDSPYQTFSVFAGNPYFIDLDMLREDGLLTEEELDAVSFGSDPENADYGQLYAHRPGLLYKAWKRGRDRDAEPVSRFREENSGWIEDYALFMAARQLFSEKPWTQWPEDIRLCHVRPDGRETIERYSAFLKEDVDYEIYVQYLFYRQWDALRAYAGGKGVEFIGDVPIYVPMDSADVWAEPGYFQLDGALCPAEVAGVPPDGFTADGQLWGNPLYDWDAMAADGFAWWLRRLKAASKLFDITRIDHFRGLSGYWAVPYGETTARNGRWRQGPGKAFIDAVRAALPEMRFIAEDLGYLTPDVLELVRYSGWPGMKVLEFAFDSREPSDYLPHNYPKNCVCYAGTHDNETARQWFEGMRPEAREYAAAYMALTEAEGFNKGLIRTGMSSVAELFVSQMQDWLGKGGEARMNTPGTVGANWKWRMTTDALTPAVIQDIITMTALYGRARKREG
jgi:4-alpha-glucanotransferase